MIKESISAKDFKTKYPTYFKKQKGGNKYNAKKTLLNGLKFDSKSESDLYAELELQRRQGVILGLETQAKESFEIYGKHLCNYYVDFKVFHNNGVVEFLEHKSTGTVTDVWRLKWKMLRAKYDKEIKSGTVICNINLYRGYKTK